MTDQELIEKLGLLIDHPATKVEGDIEHLYRIARRALQYDAIMIGLIEELGRHSDAVLQDYRAKLRGLVGR